MAETVIQIENVCKKFSKTLRSSMKYGAYDLTRNFFGLKADTAKLRLDEFWAVDNVSFEVKRGETIGLIGVNGSGKSTLLKMLNGIYFPDRGRIKITGKVGALIEVGAGFHPMLTGRENIYINGQILGMSKAEIDRKLEAIIDFAGIGEFIDSPIRHYSSGMYVRLGFAVAVHCEPDILLVDEVLAVGDRDFQIKCFKKMHELKNSKNITIILVTHNEDALRVWAQKAVVLNGGRLSYFGNGEKGLLFYINKILKESNFVKKSEAPQVDSEDIIKQVTFRDANENKITKVETGKKVIIDFDFQAERLIKNPIFGINFSNAQGIFAGFWNSYENLKLPDIKGKGTVRLVFEAFNLPVNNYFCSVVVCEKEESNVQEWKDLSQQFKVERTLNMQGFVKLPQKWSVIRK